jgi:SAM-dependent methyltransferase
MPKHGNSLITRRALVRAIAGAACVTAAGCITPMPGMFFTRMPGVPFEPTPMDVVSAMLRLADIRSYDTVFDLGCGDGRIVMAAARFYGVRGVCVDVDRYLIYEGRENARVNNLYDKVLFLNQDMFDTDLGDATVVMLYLSQEMNLKLRPKLQRELRPGSRIVSHWHDMGDWQPREVVQVTSGGRERPIYLWVIEGSRESVVAQAKTP